MVLRTTFLNDVGDGIFTTIQDVMDKATFSTDNTTVFEGDGDFTLSGEVVRKAVDSVTQLSSSRALVSASLGSSEGNGNTIAGFGLLEDAGTAEQLRQHDDIDPGVGKTSAVELWVDVEIKWTITQP